jgi:serine/threonine protein kinase
MGVADKKSIVYLIDFGLAKMFKHPTTGVHIRFKQKKSLTGTPRFASIDNHKGCETGRKDDLESLAYILVYLLKGALPWQGI